MAEIGTATVKVLPDLDEFQAIINALPKIGLTIREQIDYERNDDGEVTRTVKTTSVVRGV